MTDPNGTPRYEFILPDHLMSRGTGEIVALDDAIALDFMPQILGSQFETVDYLRQGVHLHGQHIGPYMDIENAYATVADRALGRGWTNIALNAYRRALHYSLQWTQGISQYRPGLIALDQTQIDHLSVGQQFADLEERLARSVWDSGDFSFNPDSYADFVREVREREHRFSKLRMVFEYGGELSLHDTPTTHPPHDPAVGREYIDMAARTRHFDAAIRAAEKLGWEEEVAKYTPEARAMPSDSMVDSLVEQAQMRRELDSFRTYPFET